MNATDILRDLRLRKTAKQISDLPQEYRPADIIQAMALQSDLRAKLAPDLGEQTGWKIGCTTQIMQDYLNITHPCAGTLYQSTTGHGPAQINLGAFYRLGLECELAVKIARDIPQGDHELVHLSSNIAGMMASIEIVDERFSDFTQASPFSLIADDFFSWGCRYGDMVPLKDIPDVGALRGGFEIDGNAPMHLGTGTAIMGNPLNALRWLANQTPLLAGQIVTLGSVVKTIYPTEPCNVVARFEGLPSVGLEMI